MNNTMAILLVCTLLILFTNELTLGDPCSNDDSLSFHNINCSIVPSAIDTHEDIRKLIHDDQMNLLKIKFDFPESTANDIRIKQSESERKERKDSSYFYDHYNWQILISPISDELITLRPNFRTLSLYTLQYGIKVLNTKVAEKPHGCLANVSHHEYLYVVKEYLLLVIDQIGRDDIMVCTSAMKNADGEAKFNPICYGAHKKNVSRVCRYLESDRWSHGLNIFIYVIKFIAILFCPVLIPASIYTSKYLNNAYRVNLEEKIPIEVMVSERALLENDSNWKFHLPMSYFKNWKCFNAHNLDVDVVYNFEVTHLSIGVRNNSLISKAHVPASLGDLIYEQFYLCKIGNDKSFRWCCASSICPQHMQLKDKHNYTCISWMKCCQGFLKLTLVLLVPQPWILRLIVYYYYERDDSDSRRLAAEKHGVSLSFKGYLLGYIAPIHWSFLLIYVVYVIDTLTFGTLVKSVMRELVKLIKESFQEMHTSMSFEILRWGVSRYLVPFSYFGLVGILLAPFYWVFITPFVLILFCFYYIPLISLLLRLVLHLFCLFLPNVANSKCLAFLKKYAEKTYLISKHLKTHTLPPHRQKTDRRAENCVHRHFQILVVSLCLSTVAGVTILMTECIGYLIDTVAFTLIGTILYTNTVLPYFSFMFMIVIYLSSSINDVRLTYLDFTKVIVSEVTNAAEGDLKREPHCSETAHFIKPGEDGAPLSLLTFGKSGAIYLRAQSLLLFINREEHASIPFGFFYKVCEIPVTTCPGSRSVRYCKAFGRFFCILIFLTFVLLVVLSFGGLYNISSTIQMVAALAGGLLPWIFQNVVQLKPEPQQVDVGTLSFKRHFGTEIKNFQEDFKVRDFEVQLLSKGDSTKRVASTQDQDQDPDHTEIEIHTKTQDGDNRNPNRYVYFAGPFQMED